LRRQLEVAERELEKAITGRDAAQAGLLAAGGDHQQLARLGIQLA
jgi:hypothetical protein